MVTMFRELNLQRVRRRLFASNLAEKSRCLVLFACFLAGLLCSLIDRIVEWLAANFQSAKITNLLMPIRSVALWIELLYLKHVGKACFSSDLPNMQEDKVTVSNSGRRNRGKAAMTYPCLNSQWLCRLRET